MWSLFFWLFGMCCRLLVTIEDLSDCDEWGWLILGNHLNYERLDTRHLIVFCRVNRHRNVEIWESLLSTQSRRLSKEKSYLKAKKRNSHKSQNMMA